jgi:protein-arginine kinase activator protein McsA
MFEKWRLKRKLKTVTKAKKEALKDVNFELAANLRDEERLLLKQLEKRKKHKKE